MKDFKKFVRTAAGVVGGIAGLIFIRAPFTTTGWELMGGSVVLGLVCFGAYQWAAPEDDA
jgi:hypothetical protein